MSGFAAIVAPSDTLDPDLLARVAAVLDTRGPDRRDRWQEGGVALLHSLYAVTVEDAHGAQPLTLDGNAWITGDIRVDARSDLIGLLRQAGRAVRPELPDSTLVLHAWHAWGEACVERLIGDFAFAIWDARARRLFCARDQFGVCPLHYALVDGMLIAANAVNAVLAHRGIDRSLDRRTIGDFLLFGYSADRARGFFTQIQRLPPAHTLSFSDGRCTVRRYWQPPAPAVRDPRMSDAERVERFSAVFTHAVSDRLRTDKAALTLSGGLDSPLIAAFAAKNGSARLDAYSAGFDWLAPDPERYYAFLVAQHLGIRFHSVSLDEQFLRPPGGLWRPMPEPRFSLRVQGGHQMQNQIAADGARVVFGGMGGDMLVAAPRSRWADLALGGRWLAFAREWHAHQRHFHYRPPFRASLKARLARGRIATLAKVPEWIDSDFAREQGLAERSAEILSEQLSQDPRIGLVEHAFWSELLVGLGSEGTGMPLKSVHPFCDVRLLDMTLGMPPAPWLHDKAILREAGRAMLPARIVRRAKTPAGGDAYFEGARLGIEPVREAIEQCPEVGRYIDRDTIISKLAGIDQLKPFEYHQLLIAGSLAQWFTMKQ